MPANYRKRSLFTCVEMGLVITFTGYAGNYFGF
jgi:hypothetical protein